MSDHQTSDELLSASRVTGADILFLHLVQLLSSKLTGDELVADPAARERVDALHREFRLACASILEKHLGRRQAAESLKALESATLQRYLAARHAMAPAFQRDLAQLTERMGDLEI